MPKTLFVIDFQIDWFDVFQGVSLADGTPVKVKKRKKDKVFFFFFFVHLLILFEVEQSCWGNFSVKSGPGNSCIVTAKPEREPWPFTNQKEERTFQPEFVLVRNFPKDIRDTDYKNELLALQFGGLHAVNRKPNKSDFV